jgi:hypothetical protein
MTDHGHKIEVLAEEFIDLKRDLELGRQGHSPR